MMNLSVVLLLSTLATLFSSSSAQYSYCSLCGSAGQLPVRWTYQFGNGMTCQQYYVQTAGYLNSDGRCAANKQVAQAACCNAATPAVPSAAVTSTTPGTYVGPTGTEGICNICRDGSYPGIPYGFIVARYVGEYTCDQLYGRGLHGMIPNYMCGPLQDFAQSVCGCGIYNPNQSTTSTVSYSLTSSARPYSGTPGTRNLRGGADSEAAEQKALPSAEDFHFETRELPADFFVTETTAEVAQPEAEAQGEVQQ